MVEVKVTSVSHCNISNNVVSSNYNGIYLWTSSNNKLINNIADSNHEDNGISLQYSSNNSIASNILSNNSGGILLYHSSNNNIANNLVNSNTACGIYLSYYSASNRIYTNSFFDNTKNVGLWKAGSNIWKSTSPITYTYNGNTYTNYLGNYWDDYTGSDANNDGIGDTPYPLDSDNDNFPLMVRFENYEIGEDTTTPPTCVIQLREQGTISQIEKIDVEEFFDIYVGDSTDDTDIGEVRFSSDESQDGIPTGEWTEWYDWDTSSGDWDAETKIKKWSFATGGKKEVWAEVKDNAGQTAKCSANIITEDLYWLAKAITSEAGSVWDVDQWVRCSDEERVAVGWTVLNRFDSGNFGSSIKDVVKNGYAYNKEPTQEIITLSEDLLKREISDPTGGATHFFSPISMPWEGDEGKFIDRLGKHFNEFDTGGGLHEVSGIGKRVYFPSWTKTLTWVGDSDNVRRAYFMFYRSINQPPVAIFTYSPENPLSGQTIIFKASDSYDPDPDGEIFSYKWNFGDGTIIEGLAEPGLEEHRFRGAMGEPKEYTVKLTVKDNKGATASYTDSITVYPLKRYIIVYSSLSLLLPPPPPKIMEVTVYYNWVDETEGQDEYIVSEVHLDSAEGLNFALYMFSIKDEGQVIWKKIHKGVGKEDVSFTYPFNVPRDCTKVIGNEHFKGLAVGHNCNLNFLVYGFELGLDLSFFRVSRTIELGPGKQTEVPSIYPEGEMAGILAALSSPAELRIYDSQGNVTGLVNGKIKEEIPNSIYDEESKTGVIFSPEDINSYSYEIVGSDEGLYGLEVTSVENGETSTFIATDIPTTSEAIHEYTIDWDALSQGEKGVTVQIDSDGNGIFEQTITTDNTFQLPIASFTYTPENPVVYETITFDASGSYDPDGIITKYEWDFGNGDIIDTTEPIITHSYTLAGDYTVNLIVTDDDGGVGDYTTTVTVISAEEAAGIIIDQLEFSVSIVPDEAPKGVSQKIESVIDKLEQVIDFLGQGKYCDAIGKLDGVIIQIEGAIDQVNEQRCSIKECEGKECICIADVAANELIEYLEQAKQGAIAIRDLISKEHPECAYMV